MEFDGCIVVVDQIRNTVLIPSTAPASTLNPSTPNFHTCQPMGRFWGGAFDGEGLFSEKMGGLASRPDELVGDGLDGGRITKLERVTVKTFGVE